MAFTSTFPFEVLETIIDSLASTVEEDQESLKSIKACAFVCHSFHLRARMHIFRSITLNGCRYKWHTPLRFCAFISEIPEIAYCVRSLDYTVREIDASVRHFANTLRSLTRLKHLTIRPCHGGWGSLAFREEILYLMHMPTLTHLTLVDTVDFAISDLGRCTGIKSLTLFNVEAEGYDTKLHQECQPLSLDSYVGDCGILIRQIYTTRRVDGHPIFDFSRLETLSLNLKKNQDKLDIRGFFNCCTQLRSIRLATHNSLVLPKGFANIFIPSLGVLRHIDLDINITDEQDALSALAFEFQMIAGKNIVEQIYLRLTFEEDKYYIGDDEWGLLGKIFSHSQHEWVKLVSFSLHITMISYVNGINVQLQQALLNLRETQFQRLVSSRHLKFYFELCFK